MQHCIILHLTFYSVKPLLCTITQCQETISVFAIICVYMSCDRESVRTSPNMEKYIVLFMFKKNVLHIIYHTQHHRIKIGLEFQK